MISRLHLVLPHTLPALRAQTRPVDATLAGWLHKGAHHALWRNDDVQHAMLEPWQHNVLQVLPSALRAQGYASANLTRRGMGMDWQQGSCLHAEPVHLLAGLNNLTLLWPPAPDADETRALLESLQPLASVAGFELHHHAASQHWYLSCTRQFKWLTYSPRNSMLGGNAGSLHELMPRGDHAPELKRLMTEMQMLLHDHPVNQRRAQRGIPAINAFWFWGDAPLELVSQPLPLHVISDEPYLKGLCEHLHQACWPVPADLATLLDSATLFGDLTEWLMVLPAHDDARLRAQLATINQWLVSGRVRQLRVYLDQWGVDVTGGRWAQALRALRKAQSLDELLA